MQQKNTGSFNKICVFHRLIFVLTGRGTAVPRFCKPKTFFYCKIKKDMKYLTLEYIKAHSRIDYDCENDLIEAYGTAAEDTVLFLLNRSYDDLLQACGGEIPSAVMITTCQIADNLIRHRSPTDNINLSVVPYNFDLMIKPYIIL